MLAEHIGITRRSGYIFTFVSALTVLLAGPQPAALAQDAAGEELTAEIRQTVVDRVAELLTEYHLSPDTGKACAQHVKKRLADGAYEGITDPSQFAAMLTADLHSVDDDSHLRVEARPPRYFDDDVEADPEENRRRMYENHRRDNFGFRKIEIMDNNIGYLDLRMFVPTEVAGETAVAAMTMLSNCDAIIIDLRDNGGGSGTMIQLIASYFFAEPKHLSSIETRGEELVRQAWTQPYVPGRKMPETPLFILTSERTGSAAEAFTYGLKHHGRATVIGEITGGAGHTCHIERVADTFNVVIPQGRPTHPVTGTGWERVGVKPHIEVSEAQALTRARLEAMKAMRARTEEQSGRSS
jgi:hypothetical protein